jgi:hypothetical protein
MLILLKKIKIFESYDRADPDEVCQLILVARQLTKPHELC